MIVCPNCNYERKEIDKIIDAGECPKCGIIYAKWKPVSPEERNRQVKKPDAATMQQAGTPPTNINRIIVIAVVIIAAIILANSFLLPHFLKIVRKEMNEVKIAATNPPAASSTPLQEKIPDLPKEIVTPAVNTPERNLSISDIVKKNTRSVVVVKTARGTGSGFFISDKGHIVTNKHVLPNESNASIKTSSGNTYKITNIVADDPDGDLVIASTDTPASEIVPVSLTSALPETGEKVLVIGNPLGLEQTVTDGIVSAVRINQNAIKYIQVTAPISMGNSGCPLFNRRGEVIGVATFQYRQGQNLNFCVASERVLRLQNGAVLASNQSAAGSFNASASRDVYCYADDQGVVHFVDWRTGMMVSRPDGSLDRVKFEKWALEGAGENPNSINPEREAQDAVDENREKIFKSIFPHKTPGDKNLTISEQQFLENRQQRLYVEIYNKAMTRKNRAIIRYNNMLRDFDRFALSRQSQ